MLISMVKKFFLGILGIYSIKLVLPFLLNSYEDFSLEILVFSVLWFGVLYLVMSLINKGSGYMLSFIYITSMLLYFGISGVYSLTHLDLEERIFEQYYQYNLLSDYSYVSDDYSGDGYISEHDIKLMYPRGLDNAELLRALNSWKEGFNWNLEKGELGYQVDRGEYGISPEGILFWQYGYLQGYTPIPSEKFQIPKSFWQTTFKIVPVFLFNSFLRVIHFYLLVGIAMLFVRDDFLKQPSKK